MHHPSSLRNRGPILEKILKLIGSKTEGLKVFEIASGSGSHMELFAKELPGISWQPTEYDQARIPVINEVLKDYKNVKPAYELDTRSEDWGVPKDSQDIVYTSNVTHISPFSVTKALFTGSSKILKPGGMLIVYGPFKVKGAFTTDSNKDFDTSLRSQNPEWGYRDVSELEREATAVNMVLKGVADMPANNLLLHFQKLDSDSNL
eukprot:TRINITY_DN30629_c0_g1_i1.p1 TRINITY_DN30629_c0_g1~~TRINITY_DN30629_c0_g1_i1.p1  ORF type:complete len:205 (+),score=35.49 TRINITY_DN30629_c0_g1_i1:94-708(+)